MSTSARAGSVKRCACSTVTLGISPTVSVGSSRPANTASCISCRNSWIRGPQMYPFSRSFEIMLMTSIRKPSTPRSSHQRIIE